MQPFVIGWEIMETFFGDNLGSELRHAVEREVATRILEKRSHQNLLTDREIEDVANFQFKLFPTGFSLGKDSAEKLRVIARTAQVEIGPSLEIKSHRKLIGPIIVWIKKATRPFIEVHLKRLFERQSLFNAQMLKLAAEQEVRIASIEATKLDGPGSSRRPAVE